MGPYADSVEELDWSVGSVVGALEANGLTQNTLVIFTSDNGPWYQGSAGSLRGRKGETYEGGVREPFAARMPGTIPASVECLSVGSTMDLLPTIGDITGAQPPPSLDGVNIWPLLNGTQATMSRDLLLYFDSWHIQCARLGRWKLHVARYNSPPWIEPPAVGRINLPLPKPELYDLERDPEEGYECGDDYPQIVADIQNRVEAMMYTFPAEVRQAWRDTQSRKPQATPPGALPVP
jgi:arylsulfatase